jgi:hypothetical protein
MDPVSLEAVLDPLLVAGLSQNVVSIPFPFASTLSSRGFTQWPFPDALRMSAVD